MLPIILIMSILCQGHAVDYGTDFVTAFPENLAYYFPSQISLSLEITTFITNTNVQIFMNGQNINTTLISTPQVFLVTINNAEISEFGVSGNSIRITGDKNITVLSISSRGASIQTNVVPPTTRLGVTYLVPSPSYTELATLLNTYNSTAFFDTTMAPMDFSYRLIVINAVNYSNSVTVTQSTVAAGGGPSTTTLGPFQLIQFPSSTSWLSVTSTAKVAVILTSPCIDTKNCRCNMVAHQLRPNDFLGTEFIVPSYADSTLSRLFVIADSSVVVTSGSQGTTVQPGSTAFLPSLPAPGSSYLTTSLPASMKLIIPGLIIDVLPNSLFSGCYLVHTTSQSSSMALLIVKTDQTSGIHMGTDPLTITGWTVVSGTGYSWATTSLSNCRSCVIWHPTSPIAVYVIESSTTGVSYGGPATVLSDKPDPNGCVVVPMELQLVNTTMSWQASRAFCNSQNMVLVSPNVNTVQDKMATLLSDMNTEATAWLGLRRSLITSEWYWHSDVSFDYSNWDYNQPSGNLCASIIITPTGNFTWHSVRCCSSMLPLCAKEMVIIGSITNGALTEFKRAPPSPPPATATSG